MFFNVLAQLTSCTLEWEAPISGVCKLSVGKDSGE